MAKKLYRSQSDRIIAGICGGLAEHFDIDSTVIRLIFILIMVLGGSGLFVYLFLWLLIPQGPKEPAIINEEKIKELAEDLKEKVQDLKEDIKEEMKPKMKKAKKRHGFLFGWILIMVGGLFLFKNFFPWFFHSYAVRYWPLLLIIVGLVLISRAGERK